MFLYLRFFGFIITTLSPIMTFSNRISFLFVLFVLPSAPLLTPLELFTHPKLVFYFHVPRVFSTSSPLGGPLSSFTASRTLCWYLTPKSRSVYEGKLVILAFQSLGLILYNTSQVHPFSHNSTMFFFFPLCLPTTSSLSIHQLMDS